MRRCRSRPRSHSRSSRGGDCSPGEPTDFAPFTTAIRGFWQPISVGSIRRDSRWPRRSGLAWRASCSGPTRAGPDQSACGRTEFILQPVGSPPCSAGTTGFVCVHRSPGKKVCGIGRCFLRLTSFPTRRVAIPSDRARNRWSGRTGARGTFGAGGRQRPDRRLVNIDICTYPSLHSCPFIPKDKPEVLHARAFPQAK